MKHSAKNVMLFILVLLIFISSVLVTTTVHASEFRVIDTCSDTYYSINQSDSVVTISNSYTSSQIFIDNNIVDAICFDGSFTFLCTYPYENGELRYTAYFCNINTEDIRFFTTSHNASTGYAAFTADKYRNIYLTDNNDRRKMWMHSEYSSSSFICPDYIIQLMCLDGERILAFTQSGVFIFSNNTFTQIPDVKPIPPCEYSCNQTIRDANNTEFLYVNNTLKPTTPPATKAEENNRDQSFTDKNITISNNCIYLPQGTTYAYLCNYFDVNKDSFIIYKKDGSVLSSGKLGTAMTAVYNSKKYTIIVMGDLTGEGNVNSNDLKSLMKHLTNETQLDTVFQKAADINRDNIINTKDLLALAGLY